MYLFHCAHFAQKVENEVDSHMCFVFRDNAVWFSLYKHAERSCEEFRQFLVEDFDCCFCLPEQSLETLGALCDWGASIEISHELSGLFRGPRFFFDLVFNLDVFHRFKANLDRFSATTTTAATAASSPTATFGDDNWLFLDNFFFVLTNFFFHFLMVFHVLFELLLILLIVILQKGRVLNYPHFITNA